MKFPSLLSGNLAGFNLNPTNNPQNKRLQAMQDSVRQLENLPSPQQTAKQMAKEKIGQLRQRLEQLRALLRYASPEQAKALARELKEIASQLASVAKSIAGSNSSGNTVSLTLASPDAQAATASTDTPSPPEVAGAETSTSSDAAETKEAAADNAPQANPAQQSSQTDGKQSTTDNTDLKKLLVDARKLLKQVAEQLKAKVANDPEAKKDLEAVQKHLNEIDESLQQDTASLTYSSLGELDVAANLPDPGGTSIDLTA